MIKAVKSRLSISSMVLFPLAAGGLVLGGCTGSHGPQTLSYKEGSTASAAAFKKRVRVSQDYTGTHTNLPGGTFTPSADGSFVVVQDNRFSGSFEVGLEKKAEVPKKKNPDKTFKVGKLRGTYYASVDGTTHASGVGVWHGVQVMRFNKRKLGIACVEFDATTTNNQLNASGSFGLVGGTKAAKRMRYDGTFTQTSQPTGGGSAVITGTVDGFVRLLKKRQGLTDECRALQPLLP